jgi:hypothetical protein
MKRFFMTAIVAAVGLSMLSATSTWAAGTRHSGSMSGHRGEFGHHFRANGQFNYGRYGFRSLAWTRYGWSNYYHCNCYWAPSYGWCFYEPSYACYLPISYYRQVYPQTFATAAPVVTTTPSVIQQTTVVTVPPAPVGGLPSLPTAPGVVPAPAAVQNTNVGAGPVAGLPSLPTAPVVAAAPTAVQKTNAGISVP